MNLPKIAKILEENPDLLVRETVLNKAEKEDQIIYGARAINRQVPTPLKKKTRDFDILTNKPRKKAKELVEELNRRLGKEEFVMTKAKHKGTFKVKDSKGKTVVDYTQINKRPKVKRSFGNKFKDIKSIKKNIQRVIKKQETEFRREKDLDALRRIKLSEDSFILN